tara:strand:+ start:47575 stop:47769 length:195 start_codon:yes stop_codon:yes gene_type:complete
MSKPHSALYADCLLVVGALGGTFKAVNAQADARAELPGRFPELTYRELENAGDQHRPPPPYTAP